MTNGAVTPTRLDGLTRAAIVAKWQEVRDILARAPGKSRVKLNSEANEVMVKKVLGLLEEAGLAATGNTKFLARGLVIMARTENQVLRARLAEHLRQTYCASVQERAAQDCHVGVDAISRLISCQ